jgi:hypothetical protein
MRSSAKWLFIAALWLRGKSISSVESRAVPEEMPTKSENIFQSLWETFKRHNILNTATENQQADDFC